MYKTPVKRYSLSKQVADKLEQMIETGTYKVGEKIPNETDLMTYFDVSRNTLREAIQSLTSAGILKVLQGDGTYVISNNRFDANMSMKLQDVSFNDINEARKTLEISLVSYAALRKTETDLVKIKSALDERQNDKQSQKENTFSDVKFHVEIAKASHNEVLFLLYKSLYSFLISNIEKKKSKTSLDSDLIDKYHEELFKAIEKGDPILAEEFCRKILNI